MSAPSSTPQPGRRALIAGATGLVGQCLLQGLVADPSVARVVAIGRRPPALSHPKLEFIPVDFARLPPLPPVDEAYLALGTTIKAAGSQAAFRALDRDANLAVAQAAQAAGATRLGLVSAMGADPRASIFYSRTKGELEQALQAMGWHRLVIARPSMLAGDREALGQPVRGGEQLAARVTRWLRPLIPANYRAIPARLVAAALLAAVPGSQGLRILLSGEMQG
ncbi:MULTISPECIES: NAD(P)H-binding protein [Ramlibacter]|uniref:NAD(P)H-binding protein n=1 Tax=Ramlibacter aquaticus TaxID=2780094 RepID=A0ABR9SHE6_9BURK|nr:MULTISPECIES: NAD(P)H-binding protein [Ramlibacter]MBE7941467.1 NAD(P)H-binding protein [Ramlibacter aquaticus]